MPVEPAVYVADLVDTYPAGNEPATQGDNHLRLLKEVLQTTFPRATKAFPFPAILAKSAAYTILSSDQNMIVAGDASGGAFSLTLPTLGVGDDGWAVQAIKIDTSANAVTVVGTINGATNLILSGQYSAASIVWTGTAWVILPPDPTPVGVVFPYAGATAPVGYLFAFGQAVSRTSYAALFVALGTVYGIGDGSSTFNLPDMRGRVVAGQDDMGGTSANRLTAQTGGLDGDTLGATGGAETHTLTTAQLAAHSHALTDPGHTHTYTRSNSQNQSVAPTGATDVNQGTSVVATGSGTTGITVNNAGSGAAHNNVQPTLILNYIIKT